MLLEKLGLSEYAPGFRIMRMKGTDLQELVQKLGGAVASPAKQGKSFTDEECARTFYGKIGMTEEQLRELKVWNLRGKQLVDADVEALADVGADGVAGETQSILMGNNSVGDAGIKALAASLQHFPRLFELWLNINQVGDAGTRR